MKEFFQIKKLIALLLTIVFCVLAYKGTITGEQFLTIFTVVIGFYYGQSSVRQTIKENNQE